MTGAVKKSFLLSFSPTERVDQQQDNTKKNKRNGYEISRLENAKNNFEYIGVGDWRPGIYYCKSIIQPNIIKTFATNL
jgi:hypothetical protein